MSFYAIYPKDISNICLKKKPVIVDIREREAYRKYHYSGAVNIPYEEDEDYIYQFSRRRPILLYCEYGSASLLAARKLGKAGYEVYTVIGGAKAMQELSSHKNSNTIDSSKWNR